MGQAVDGVIGFNEAVFIIGVGIGGVGSHHAGGTALQVFLACFWRQGTVWVNVSSDIICFFFIVIAPFTGRPMTSIGPYGGGYFP